MNKLIKKCTFGDMTFNIATNREIALKVAKKFPDETDYVFDASKDAGKYGDFKTVVKSGKLDEFFSRGERAIEINEKFARFALPLMLEEADDKTNADDIIKYAIENDADQILFANIAEVVLMGFTTNGEIKTPKIQFSMD